jgi:hypothetical protein
LDLQRVSQAENRLQMKAETAMAPAGIVSCNTDRPKAA